MLFIAQGKTFINQLMVFFILILARRWVV